MEQKTYKMNNWLWLKYFCQWVVYSLVLLFITYAVVDAGYVKTPVVKILWPTASVGYILLSGRELLE